MRIHPLTALTFSSLVFSAIACGAAPDASESAADQAATQDELGISPWLPHTETLSSAFAYLGSPAWSEDASEVSGIELSYERRLEFPPLQGWVSKRNFTWRLFTQSVNGNSFGSRQYVGRPQVGYPGYLFDMKAAGAFLVYVENKILLVRRDGTVTVVHETKQFDLAHHIEAVPSPDGRTIAIADFNYNSLVPQADGSNVTPNKPVPCVVSFVNTATLAPVGAPVTVSLPEAEEHGPTDRPSYVTWTPAGKFVVTDRAATAFAIAPGAAPQAVAVPTCTGPTTASGKIAADGRRLGISWNKIAVVGTAGVNERFGCR